MSDATHEARSWLRVHYDGVIGWFQNLQYMIFTPSCHLKIRNLPRGFVDRSGRMLHAMFSLLCDYVELEIGGENEYRRRLAELYNSKDELTKSYYKKEARILALYVWYNKVNWKEPVPFPDRLVELCSFVTDRKLTPEEKLEEHELLLKWGRASDRFENSCVRRMHEIVTVSPYLWT